MDIGEVNSCRQGAFLNLSIAEEGGTKTQQANHADGYDSGDFHETSTVYILGFQRI